MPPAAILMIWRVPEGNVPPPSVDARQRYGLIQSFRSILNHRPMMWLVGAALPIAILSGMEMGMMFLFLDIYLELGENYPIVQLAAAPVPLVGVPLWGCLGVKFERHQVVAVSLIVASTFHLGLSFISPGPMAFPLALVATVVVLFPMLGDITDYGRLQTGKDFSGLYTAVFNFVQVSLRTVSRAGGIALVGWVGLDATAVTQNADGALAIRLTAVILPAIGFGFAGVLFWGFL